MSHTEEAPYEPKRPKNPWPALILAMAVMGVCVGAALVLLYLDSRERDDKIDALISANQSNENAVKTLCQNKPNDPTCVKAEKVPDTKDIVDESEIQDPEIDDPEIQDPEIQDPEDQNAEEQDPERNDPEVQDDEQQDGDPNDPDPVDDPDPNDPDPDDPENQDPENQDPEVDDPDPASPFTFQFTFTVPPSNPADEAHTYTVTCNSGTGNCTIEEG